MLFPSVNRAALQARFDQYQSLKCSVTGAEEYARFDLNPPGAGAAQVKFSMKQIVARKNGLRNSLLESLVTMVVSRYDRRSPWLVDRVSSEPKPRP